MSQKNAGPVVTLAYDGHSDADSQHRPSDHRWQQCSPDWVRKVYLAKLAQKYMEDTKQAVAGKWPLICCFLPYLFFAIVNIVLSNPMPVKCLSPRVP